MYKTVPCEIAGKPCLLHFSMGVFFDVQEKFGGFPEATEAITGTDRAGFEALLWLALRLAREGEMARRAAGYDPEPLLTEEDAGELMSPREYAELRAAVIRACTLAYSRETEPEDGETDLVILELAEKKTPPGR